MNSPSPRIFAVLVLLLTASCSAAPAEETPPPATLPPYQDPCAAAAARAVEIHERSVEGDIMRMRPVEAVEIPADGQVELKPGGYHIMLIDLQRDLQPVLALSVLATLVAR